MDTYSQAREELFTLRDFIRFAASHFEAAGLCFGHGTDNALDEAAALVMHALHLPHTLPAPYLDARLTTTEKTAVIEFIRRRVEERKPLAYLTQCAWFAGHAFHVDERVLVPRSPIAELIARRFTPWIETDWVGAVLDLCAGSGCIGIACAHAFPEARVDLAELSPGALDVANINIARHELGGRVRAVQSNLFGSLHGERYDIIVSNPPYVAADELPTLPEEYRHEPGMALDAGSEGLDFALRILAEAREHLTPHGILVVEVGGSAGALIERLPHAPFLWLEFEHGGDGVFLLTAEQLDQSEDWLVLPECA
jgi:ribosomal protein L3 glutamine methyltransferase